MFTALEQLSLPGVPAPTHLDTSETTVESKSASPIEETTSSRIELVESFRHSGWKADRARILDAFYDARVSCSRTVAFCACGSGHWVMRSKAEPERFKVIPNHCHDRMCVPCGGARQAVIRRNLDRLLTDVPHRFLTLTIRHADEPLAVLLTRLYRAFRLLRNRRLWKDRVRGGVAFLELTYNDDTGSWNPHLHCMLEGLYIPLPDLSALWLCCTGDSHNVKIKLIRNKPYVIGYVTKYATKPLPASVVSNEMALVEAIEALAKRRTVISFGRWKNWKLLDDPGDEGWELFATLESVRFQAMCDDPLCSVICSMVDTADPHTGEFTINLDLPPPDD